MAFAAVSSGRIKSLQLQHHVELLQKDDMNVLSWKQPGSDRVICNKTHGGGQNSIVLIDSRTSRGVSSRRNYLNLDLLREQTTSEQKFMLQGMYNNNRQQPQQGIQRESVRSPGYRAMKLLGEVVHGVTRNSSNVAKAVTIKGVCQDRYRKLMQEGCTGVEDAYWELLIEDVRETCDMLVPIYNDSRGEDGYVSVEIAPYLARHGVETLEAAKWIHGRVDRPNLYIRIPSTEECLPEMKRVISSGISVNSTLIFSLERYEAVAEAYLQGLESTESSSDLSHISGLACFFVSSVDAHVMHTLEELGAEDGLSCPGKAACAIAAVAFKLHREKFSGPRWAALEKRGAKKQRLVWVSTSDDNLAYQDTLYGVPLLKPDDVKSVPSANPQEAFLKHMRTENCHHICEEYCRDYEKIQKSGVCWSDVAHFLEQEGINSYQDCFERALTALVKADLEDLFSK